MASQEPKVPSPTISFGVVFKFVLVSLLMVITPTSVFFLSHYRHLDWLWEKTIGIPDDKNLPAVSGIAAVLCVNLVVGLFVFMAFTESDVVRDKRSGVKSD